MSDTDVLYAERQYFRQEWLWALLLVSSVPVALLGVVAVVTDSDPGTNVPLWVGFVLVLVFGPLVVCYRANLRITVQSDGLTVRMWPFHVRERHVHCNEIRSVTVTRISPLGDFDGYGVRLNPTVYRWGVSFDGPLGYVVSGEDAVRIERETQRDLIVTSEQPRQLRAAVERACDAIPNHND